MTQAKRLLTLLLLVCLAAGPLSLPSLALNEAKIEGGSEYATVQEAVDAAVEGDTVTLLTDVTVEDPVSVTTDLTFDLGGHTLSGAFQGTQTGVFQAVGCHVDIVDSAGGGSIVNTLEDKPGSVLYIKPSADAAGSVTLKDGVTLENLSTYSTSVVVYLHNAVSKTYPARLEVQNARLISQDGDVIRYKSSFGRRPGEGAISGGEFWVAEKAASKSILDDVDSDTLVISGGIFHNWDPQADTALLDDGALLCHTLREGALVMQVVSGIPDAAVQSAFGGQTFYLLEGTDEGGQAVAADLYTLQQAGLMPDGAQLTVLKDVTCTFPEGASFGSSNHPAASLGITVAQGASLSGTLPLKLADVTVSGEGDVSGFSVKPFDDTFRLSEESGLYRCRLTQSGVKATVTLSTGEVLEYSSIAMAISDARTREGSTVTFYDDYKTQKSIKYGLNGDADTLTLDLNGHTYCYDTLTTSPAFLLLSNKTLTLRNGRLEADPNALAAIATDDSSNGSRIVIESDFTVAGNSVLLVGTSPSLELFGTIDTTGTSNTSIQGNGSTTQNSSIVIKEGARVLSDKAGIYHPQFGTLTVEGGLITGSTGIVMKSGHLEVTGGEISATGARAPYAHEPSGYISTGDAVVLEACNYPGGAPSAEISGGLLSSQKAQAVVCYLKDGAQDMDNKKFVTGGEFSSDPTAYLGESLMAVPAEQEGFFGVRQSIENVVVSDGTPVVTVEPARELTRQERNALNKAAALLLPDDGTAPALSASGLVGAAGSVADTVDMQEALDKLEAAGVEVSEQTPATLFVLPYLNVKLTDLELSEGALSSLTLALDFKVKTVVSTAQTADGIHTEGGPESDLNAVPLGDEPLVVSASLTLSLPLPDALAQEVLSVFHLRSADGSEACYDALVQQQQGVDVASVVVAKGAGTLTLTPADTRSLTVTFDNGVPQQTYGVADIGSALPKASKTGYLFRGWLFDKTGDESFETLSEALWSALFAGEAGDLSVDATASLTRRSSGGAPSGTVTPSYTVSASAGEGGSISPSGKTSVDKGDDLTFAITPDEGYVVDDVLVDGVSVGSVTSYTLRDVAKSHTISASFVPDDGGESAWENPFDDVDEAAWYFDAVRYVFENGLLQGTSDTLFSPDLTTTRAMIVTVLWRMAEEPVINYAMTFDDVPEGLWYSEAVRWAAGEGIVTGYDDTRFGPNDAVTREQLAAMLYRYAVNQGRDVSVGEDTNILSYADAFSVSEYAVSALQWACGEGIVTGRDDGTLSPQDSALRSEFAAMLMRFCGAQQG